MRRWQQRSGKVMRFALMLACDDYCEVDLLPVIASILGTTSVSAIVTALLAPKSEAKRLKTAIADLKLTFEDAPAESKEGLRQALHVECLRLASLSLVRFQPIVMVVTGFLGLVAFLGVGFLLFNFGLPGPSETEGGLELVGALILPLSSFSSWLLLVGLIMIAIVVGVAIGFFRSMLLHAARTRFLRDCLAQHPQPATSQPTDFQVNMDNFDRWLTEKLFSFH